MDILEREKQEQADDNQFWVRVGIIALIISLALVFFTSILPVIESVNPVGNLIIIR